MIAGPSLLIFLSKFRNIDSNKENISIKFSGEADIHETHNVKKMLKSLDNHHDDLGGKDGCLCRDEVTNLLLNVIRRLWVCHFKVDSYL